MGYMVPRRQAMPMMLPDEQPDEVFSAPVLTNAIQGTYYADDNGFTVTDYAFERGAICGWKKVPRRQVKFKRLRR